MINRLHISIPLLLFFCICSCSDDTTVQEELIIDTLTWTLEGQDYSVTQESIVAEMNYTSDANVNHLGITGTTETGEVLVIYVQELWGSEGCLMIATYNSEVIEDDCFDNGFLVICDHGACEYETSDNVKFKSLDQAGGYVNISACDDENNSITGDFELMLQESGSTAEPMLIKGSFVDLVYEVK